MTRIRASCCFVLLTDRVPLNRAEPYGDCLTYSSGHHEFWSYLRRFSADSLAAQSLPAVILADEYEEWPRGRVVYDTVRECFIIYADRKAQTAGAINRITATFDIPQTSYLVACNGHYQSSQLLSQSVIGLPWTVAIAADVQRRSFHVFSAQTPEDVRAEVQALPSMPLPT